MNRFEISFKDLFLLYLYLGFLLLLLVYMPKTMTVYYEARMALIGLGFLSLWRYGWWLTHAVRSLIYSYIVFPKRRRMANELWVAGWRPRQVFFMMTTFKELKETTERVLASIFRESRALEVPIKLFVGIGDVSDEKVITDYFKLNPPDFPIELKLVYQKQPGKRFAIGETLRAMQPELQADDPVIFMDGDTLLMPRCLEKCLPFFPLFPKLQALTTHEKGIILNGPLWMKRWLDLRFVQRDFTMRSYSLSGKILTLTGRMSIFRGKHLLEPEFINMVEYDNLDHWLWGNYRFLSGDDKSTWYYLLKSKADMFYIPDATTLTIEYIQGNAFFRMKENLRRWSGNTLRNGARAIALGPRTVGLYIWWCLIDQRIAIWTLPIGLAITLILAVTKTVAFLVLGLLWIGFSRLIVSIMLFFYAKRIDVSFPFILYFNQLMSSFIKIYILFRLPQQRWQNRDNQSAGFSLDRKLKIKHWVAHYLTAFYCVSFLMLVLIYLGLIAWPTLSDVKVLFHGLS